MRRDRSPRAATVGGVDDLPSADEQHADDQAAKQQQLAEWQAAGLYDPALPGADGRLALLQWIAAHGIDTQQMVAACAAHQLTSLVGDLHLRPRPTLTVDALAARTGLTVEALIDLRRATGFPPGDPNEPIAAESEVEMFRMFGVAGAFFSRDELLHFVRVMASSLRRIGEAASEMFLRDVEAPLQEVGRDELALARANLGGVQLVDSVTGVFEPMFRLLLQATTQQTRRARAGEVDYSTVPLTIGFVDLSGFTERSGSATPAELLEMVVGFESTALDLVTEHGGRLIKLIGDEVMFTTVTPTEGCAVALGLLRRAEQWGVPARGGLAHGPVVTSGGDVYGSTVNLASRIADIAVPGEVLADDAVTAATTEYRFQPAGRRQLKGFPHPVPLWSLEP